MIIGLLDCDRKGKNQRGMKMPNFALMKISAYHKSVGDVVEWVDGTHLDKYGKIYASKVFNFTPDPTAGDAFADYKGELIKGGTGYSVSAKLPAEIETQCPDYSIYPQCDYAIGFVTRGCIHKCKPCCVPEKEGELHYYADWRSIKRPDSKKLVLMDNNILAYGGAIDIICDMAAAGVWVDFNQGLDATLFTEYHAAALAALKIRIMTPASGRWRKGIRFSCDRAAQIPHIARCIELMSPYGYKPRDFSIYCLLTSDYDDSVRRVEALRKLGVCVNAQPYRDLHTVNTVPRWQSRMATYTFKRSEFFATSWDDYSKK